MMKRGRGMILVLMLSALVSPEILGAEAPAPASPSISDHPLLDGLAEIHQGRFSRGNRIFRSFLAAHPTDPRGHLFLAFCEWWRQVQRGEEGPSRVMEYHLEEGIRLAREWAGREPGRPEALTTLGTGYIFLAQYQAGQGKVFRGAGFARKGRTVLEQVWTAHPELVDAGFGLGAYNYYADKVNLLVKGLRTLFFLPGGDSSAGLAQLAEVAARGRYFRTEAHLLLAVIYQGHHEYRYRSALDHLQEALALNPDSPLILATLGELQLRMGRYAEAGATLNRCVAIAAASPDPDHADLARLARILLADTLDLAGNSEQAFGLAQSALTGGELAPGFRRRGLAVATRAGFRLGERDRVLALYRALGLSAEQEEALNRRHAVSEREVAIYRALAPARELLERGENRAAADSLKSLLARHPGAPEILFELGRATWAEGQVDEARRCFLQIGAPGRPPAPVAVMGWANLYLGRDRALAGKAAEGREYFRRAAELSGFRARDLARALMGPEGDDPSLWPDGNRLSGLKNL